MADTEVPFLAGLLDAGEPPLAGVSDYRGRPVYRETSGGLRSAVFVLAVEVASSFAFFGVSANLITYLTGPLGQTNAAAAAAVNAWVGTASLMPLLGAFIADSWLGRYLSIILACALYALGYGMLALASTLVALQVQGSASQPSSLQVAFFYASLYLVALAQGADSPCSLAFAADQFDPSHPMECAARSSFFNLWYFCFAAGITIGVGLVGYIQENLGWEIGFGMLCATVLCALGVFLLGTSAYRLYAPTSSNADNPVTLLAESLALLLRERCSFLGTKVLQYKLEDQAAVTKKEEARNLLRLLSIWAACLSYGAVFAQVMTLFNKQGHTLDRRIIGGLELPPAALQMFGPATILLFVPFYDWALVPTLRYATGNPSGLTLLQRIGTGILLSLATMLTAALVEARRLKTVRDHGLVDDIAGATVPMSWVWLVPQYVTIGVAGVFAEVGMQEFFYDQMPDEMRSLGLALYFGVMGIGSFVSGALISVIDHLTKSGGGDSWFADNLNRGHLDYFYWLLAGLSASELLLYLYITSSYTYINQKRSR